MAADVNDTVEATLERANRLFTSGLGGTLGILKEADSELSKRLHALVKKKGTKDLKFTEAQALLYRKQIHLVQAYLDQRLLGHTHAQALKAVASGVKTTTALLKKLEKNFTGIAKPLQLESQQHQDALLKGTGASLLRQHVTSVGRYSTAMIADFERVMRVGALSGMTQHQVISKLVAQGDLGGINAAKLHAAEPGYFPKPAGYVTRRYWAERIVRTETAFAYNAANQATIATARVVDFPDMQKKILAHFDQRTAPDSIAVHGQIRPVDGLFTDGAGRNYKHPPARPNDRETVIPWRPHWTELPATKQAPPEAQAAAQVEAQPAGLAPMDQEKKHVQASRAKVVALVEAAKAKQAETLGAANEAQKYQQAKAAAEAAQLKGTKALGAAKLADGKALAKAQAAAAVKGAKLKGVDPAVLKAKAEQYKAEIQAKAAAKVAELEAARAAKLKTLANQKIGQLSADAKMEAKFGEPSKAAAMLVGNLKKLQKAQPAVWAELQKQLEIGGVSPHAVSVAMAKKMAPEADFSAFKKKAPKPVPPPAAEPTAPKLPPLEFKTVSGFIDIHDATTGAKLAYMKAGPGGVGVSITPPTNLGLEPKTFATPEEGAPYALKVSAAIQLAKAEAAAKASAKAAADAAEEKAARSRPVVMKWSDKWKPPARKPLELGQQAAVIDKGLSKPTRAGVSVAGDGDFVEDFQINFTTEIRQGQRETVARFRVNESHASEVMGGLTKAGGKPDNFPGYAKLKGLDNPELEFASTHGEFQGSPPGVTMYQAGIKGTTVRFFAADGGSAKHPALKNLMEVRFEEPKGKGERWKKFEETTAELGIKVKPPTAEALETYKRVKVLSVADKNGALQLGALKKRTPEAVSKIWEEATKRDPRLLEIAATAALREVAPGQYALYSEKLAERYRATGVTHMTHNISGGAEVIQVLMSNEESGLLSSRERFQRGLVFRGMSTDTDFSTGGADSVFLRLARGAGKGSGDGWIEVDPSELGRFDVYAFNADKFGRAGSEERESRMRLSDLEKMGAESLSSSNETMMRRAVAPTAIRRVLVGHGQKTQIVEHLKKRGVTEYGGVPIEDLIQE